MNKNSMSYFEKDDILLLSLSGEPEGVTSVEINPNIRAELNAEGRLIGIVIFGASAFIQESLLDNVQAKLLQLGKAVMT
ncbi:MAG: DUF2283 domain-containing protein [Candidatus Electrothrix sp. AR3]|nr:DUF2283 domain-containing protein [Candidatus Electrothrix sp. AR3]